MRIVNKLEKLVTDFKYLKEEFCMRLIETNLKGSFPYVEWSNGKKNVTVGFDLTDDNPIHIFIHNPEDIAMYSAKEFVDEFKYTPKSNRDIYGYIDYAAQKFYEMLKQDSSILE